MYGTLSGADLAAAAKVKWVQTANAGVETLDAEFMASPIVLTNMARVSRRHHERAWGAAVPDARHHHVLHATVREARDETVGRAKSPEHVELPERRWG